MFDFLFDNWFGDWWSNVGRWFESTTDYFTGYTSANQQWRFQQQGMALQNAYNLQNMAAVDAYQRNLMREGPSIQREGLEKAGFNPMLAIQGGVSSPSSGVTASTPSFSAPTPHGFGIGDIINAVSSAFGNYASLSKLGSDVALTNAQADAIRANSAADVALKGAEAQKILKETDSIDPRIRRQNERFGNTFVGDLMRLGRNAVEGAGFDFDAHPDVEFLKNVSSNSAKGLDGAVKVMNEKSRLIREERKRRVEEGRANPRRQGRQGRKGRR